VLIIQPLERSFSSIAVSQVIWSTLHLNHFSISSSALSGKPAFGAASGAPQKVVLSILISSSFQCFLEKAWTIHARLRRAG
jgi:hypothetical protein